jgi:uncharacterized membrane protein YccC
LFKIVYIKYINFLQIHNITELYHPFILGTFVLVLVALAICFLVHLTYLVLAAACFIFLLLIKKKKEGAEAMRQPAEAAPATTTTIVVCKNLLQESMPPPPAYTECIGTEK